MAERTPEEPHRRNPEVGETLDLLRRRGLGVKETLDLMDAAEKMRQIVDENYQISLENYRLSSALTKTSLRSKNAVLALAVLSLPWGIGVLYAFGVGLYGAAAACCLFGCIQWLAALFVDTPTHAEAHAYEEGDERDEPDADI